MKSAVADNQLLRTADRYWTSTRIGTITRIWSAYDDNETAARHGIRLRPASYFNIAPFSRTKLPDSFVFYNRVINTVVSGPIVMALQIFID